MSESIQTQPIVKVRRLYSKVEYCYQHNCSKLELTRGMWSLIDEEDAERLSVFAWRIVGNPCSWYAARTPRPWENRGTTTLRLTYEILNMNPSPGVVIDHIDGNTLDNRKSNLRICTQADNQHNRRKNSGSQTSKYKGVHLTKRVKKPWTAQIGISGRTQYIGIFETAEDAARAYDRRAMLAFGPYALLNFPIKRLKQA